MAEKKRYTVIDFERYHSGKMTPKEMHDLEKAALDDPFLADALEGYFYSSNPVNESTELKAAILHKKPSSRNRVAILRIAAAFFVIAAAALWIFQTAEQDEIPIAQTETFRVQDTSVTTENPQTAARQKNAPSPKTIPESSSVVKQKGKPEPKEMNEIPRPEIASLNADTVPSSIAPVSAPLAASRSIHDSNAREIMKYNDSGQIAALPKRDTSPRHFFRNKLEQRSAILKPVDTERLKMLEEAHNYSNFIMESPLPEPVEGWKKFDEYLQENKPVSKHTGTVTLEFVVSLTGHPTKIFVVHSTCSACEKSAVLLLRDGPKWKNSIDGKAEVTLVF